MRRAKRQGGDQAEVNMTPMLDIVFILLIFFIVTATFLTEEGIDMRPPPPAPEDTPIEPTPPILVSVDEDNNVFVNNERTSALRVPAAVARIRAEEPGAAVVISPNDEAEHGLIVEMYDSLRADSIPVIITRPDGDN